MVRSILRIATVISAASLAATLVLAIASYGLDPQRDRVSFGDDFHIAVRTVACDVRLTFFNDAEYGPYVGSIIDLSGGRTTGPPEALKHYFGDTAGIYYRDFQWPDDSVLWPNRRLWTLALSLWYPAILFAILPVWWWVRRGRGRRRTEAGSDPVRSSRRSRDQQVE